jgi:uncharacterized protein YbbC (DUF1343 family)
MEACAENNKQLIVLDRPNPNGYFVDGPLLHEDFKSFVGLHPVPVVYGMTIGEYARMVNEEKWLSGGLHCNLVVIPCLHYDHTMSEALTVKPSPNLPNQVAVLLYPSLCFFEGTVVSVGRGTDKPFQQIGHPYFEATGKDQFTPLPTSGAKHPLYENQVCYGYDLSSLTRDEIVSSGKLRLTWLIEFHNKWVTDEDFSDKEREPFFNAYFDLLAGTDELRNQIEAGLSEEEIRTNWHEELVSFKAMRKKYLLYQDFE